MAQGEIGDEVLACRPSIVYAEGGVDMKAAGPPIVASWTDDESLSARINDQVAHLCASLKEGERHMLELRMQGYSQAEIAGLRNAKVI